MESYTMLLKTPEETWQAGQCIGSCLKPGDVLLLKGEMGSGKTTICKSICQTLSVNPDVVISPTYTIVNVYSGRYPVFHVDLYRLSSSPHPQLDDFDREDLIASDGITLVEWPDLLFPFLMDDPVLWLNFSFHGHGRQLTLESSHAGFGEIFQSLRQDTTPSDNGSDEYSGN
ncbi:MAG: tRNA (adenosine(37)-N6)-threonylcarbamoyltransferase complex ATPase subunit type 1 TsaE [SAR324 cluster bacterium]|nr:tRNA (adenosine(37)-N6)-threonylcarbamoyltransferase complex ATPase subunit type 1 TsaE [SAR324 cluster bacterium]MBF0350549.1 tRNA (adenosine(37)-N6)-threonylcarbamoyltransferase complex ATPase subunit type 1 TsaE [SAR324 cluster bacterium]